MGQPRLITAQFNRIQCGRRRWLQGPASSCVITAEKKRRKEEEFKDVVKMCMMGKNVKKKDQRVISEYLITVF